jgi:hypothetical protein
MAEQGQGRKDEIAAQFLRLCLRGRWDPAALEDARALSARNDLDWAALRRVVHFEGLAPLLYHITRGQDLLPPPVEQALRHAYYGNAGRNLLLLRDLEDVLSHLTAEGLPVILLKGAALAQAVYRNFSVRPMGDVDLLVRREKDLPTALRVLAALGYDEIVPPQLTYTNQLMLRKPGRVEIPIEVHWSLFTSLYQHALTMNWFWQTTLPVDIGDASARILGPEAQLLYLCGHILLPHGRERGPRLLWLHDVAEVIARYRERIDWEQVLAQAQAHYLVLPVQQVLARVGEEWNAPIPPVTLERLRALRPSPDEERVFAWFATTHSSVTRRFWADLRNMPGWGPRLRLVWRNLFPPAGYMQHGYRVPHRLLVPLYYPYRWFLGLRRVLRRGER